MSLITETFREGVKTIKLNRPKKKNAFNQEMYINLAKILNDDAKDDKIVITIFTGEGEYFSSGNDLTGPWDIEMEVAIQNVKLLVDAFINYPKLLICVVNGPAIGIGATIVTVCDIVYSSDRASFETPFIKLNLCLEGTSSFSFPIILGRSLASEALFLNRKLSADEALHSGLVSRVIPHSQLDEFINGLHKYGSLSVNTIKRNKSAVLANFKKFYSEANARELDLLKECTSSDEFLESMQKWLERKSKL